LKFLKKVGALLLVFILMSTASVFASNPMVQSPKIKSINNIKISINSGEKFTLPKTVRAILTNNKTLDVSVKWNVNSIDTSKAEKHVIYGSVAGYSKKVELNLIINKDITIERVEDINALIDKDVRYTLPAAVEGKLSDGTVKQVPVTWNPSTINTNVVGTFIFSGTITGYSNSINLKIEVVDSNNSTYLNYAGDKMLNYDYMVDQKDTDGDGLTDYEEMNKYCTDPGKKDSDGDGKQDGDWEERTEYTYTITARRELDSPFNSASLKDTFEDIKIISESKNKLVYDAILYPYAKDNVTGNPKWKEYSKNPAFYKLLMPRKTANWDQDMQQKITASIPENCRTDLDVVKFLVPYYLNWKRLNPAPVSKHPADLFVDLRGDKPVIYSKKYWDDAKVNKNVSDEDLIDQALFAKRMFNDRIDGACTASATYLMAVLRAAGIPARGIETNALLDYGDKTQETLLNNLKNTEIRETLLNQKPSYYGHYYIEAYIGGRWIKINNNGTIMEDNYIETYPGVFHIKADTFFDYSDTAMVDIFKNYYPARPYRLVAISDKYGEHYDDSKQPVNRSSMVLGIDMKKIEGIYLYGGKEFCERPNLPFDAGKIKSRASINLFKEEILKNSNLIVLSNSDIPYERIPEVIKEKINAGEYRNLSREGYINVKLDKATIVVIK
jgi:hypothetical protein